MGKVICRLGSGDRNVNRLGAEAVWEEEIATWTAEEDRWVAKALRVKAKGIITRRGGSVGEEARDMKTNY